jgi:type I restriction enzyme S subunit
MTLSSYENLAPSTVIEGLDLPEHWRKVRFRHLFSFDRGLGITKANLKDEGIPCVNYGEIHSRLGFEVIPERDYLKFVDEDYLETSENALLNKGDFVFADTSEDLEGSGNFTHLNSDETTFAGYHTVIARLQSDDLPRFLAYLFHSEPFRTQIRQRVTGVKVFSVTQAILKSCFLWLPTIDEQKRIVNFLDLKTKIIDELIDRKNSIIAKLIEKRVSLISRTSTKGLSKNVDIEDSEVDWLGDIPSHWKVKRLRFVIESNPVKSKLNKTDSATQVSFIPMDAIGEYGGIRLDQNREIGEVYSGYTYLADKDVIVAKITPCFENGKGALAEGLTNGIGFGTTELHVMRPENEINKKWLFYLSISHAFRKIGESEMYGAGGQKRVPENFIKNFRVGIPPLDEQNEIVRFIDIEINKLNKMIAINKAAIENLQDYRDSLITASVTGQLDLSNSPLPGDY